MPRETFLNLPEEKRKRITEVLIRHFSSRGYYEVNLDQVAKDCGIAKGSLFQYFKDKGEMYLFAVDRAFQRFMEIVQGFDFKKGSIFEYYESYFESSLEFLIKEEDAYYLLERAFFYNDSPFREKFLNEYTQKTHQVVLELVRENQKNGFIRKDIDPELLALFLEAVSLRFKTLFFERLRKEGKKVLDLPREELREFQSVVIKLLAEGLKGR
ncbi:MAG: TetR/AcrR family transcriptional regulator [Caldiserica bacterium]|jgi:AcrR family transcriptional regulator|nr:TetR/AcrR family transcriptional regulator [Caldisericota bacterium]MDH7562207.1 TetR/AcrR family transcriptional regulator [Caldisericota bacterium]